MAKPKMIKIKAFKWISRVCAEDLVPTQLNDKPEDILDKLFREFKNKPGSHGVMRFYKRTIFPSYHYLEMKVVDGRVECRLKVNAFDRFLVGFMVFFALAGISFGLFSLLNALFSSSEKEHYLFTGLALAGAGFGIIFFACGLYRFLRWISGLSRPLNVLSRCGVN